MPILWSYLIKKFLTQFSITLFGIICFLIVIRFSSIAGFATSGTDFSLILKFVGLLIPYVLPFAIPISTLNAALLVARKLSNEKQFTALRSGGLSLKTIFFPMILIFSALSVFNFFTAGTLASLSKIKSKALIYDTTMKHPLFITQKACPIKIKTLFADVGNMSSKDTAHDLVLVFKNKKNKRLSLLMADKLSVHNGVMQGKNLAIVSSLKSQHPHLADDLIIENEAFMTTSTDVVDALLYKDEAVEGMDYMDFFYLIKNLKKRTSYRTEIYKRINLALAPLAFGCLGLSFGISISRKSSNLSLSIAIALATLFLVVVISLKPIRAQSGLCLLIFALTQIILFVSAFLKISRVEKGRE